jgi:hypothetical protein
MAQSMVQIVKLILTVRAFVLESALLAVRKHVATGSAVVLVRVQGVHLALSAKLVVQTFYAVVNEGPAFVTGTVVRSEARIVLTDSANG